MYITHKIQSEERIWADLERMLTVKETMTLLGVSRQTIHHMTVKGKLRAMRLKKGLRYRRGDILTLRDTMMEETTAT